MNNTSISEPSLEDQKYSPRKTSSAEACEPLDGEFSDYIDQVVEERVAKRLNEMLRHHLEEVVSARLEKLDRARSPEPLWGIKEVAEYLGVSERQVHYFLADGRLTSMRIGRKHRFEPKAVQRFARSNLGE